MLKLEHVLVQCILSYCIRGYCDGKRSMLSWQLWLSWSFLMSLFTPAFCSFHVHLQHLDFVTTSCFILKITCLMRPCWFCLPAFVVSLNSHLYTVSLTLFKRVNVSFLMHSAWISPRWSCFKTFLASCSRSKSMSIDVALLNELNKYTDGFSNCVVINKCFV